MNHIGSPGAVVLWSAHVEYKKRRREVGKVATPTLAPAPPPKSEGSSRRVLLWRPFDHPHLRVIPPETIHLDMGVMVISSLEEFKEITQQASPVVIEFCASWSWPSQKINPTFDKCSERLHYDGLNFYRVDIDNQPDIVQAANVQKIPFFAVYKEGKRLGLVEGADNRALATLLENHS